MESTLETIIGILIKSPSWGSRGRYSFSAADAPWDRLGRVFDIILATRMLHIKQTISCPMGLLYRRKEEAVYEDLVETYMLKPALLTFTLSPSPRSLRRRFLEVFS